MKWGTLIAALGLWPAVCPAAEPVDFAHDVVPVLKKHCVGCHGGTESKGGFSLNTRQLLLDGEAAAPGQAAKSRLVELIRSTDAEEQMPPKDKPRLTAAEIATLERWIDEGLKWEPSFTFAPSIYEPPLKPRVVKLPPAQGERDNPVDRILDKYLADRRVAPPAEISDAAFQRRLFLDVIGLLPTPEEQSEFLNDSRPDKRQLLIDSLLKRDTDYALHWLTFWNDLLRNDYSGTGYIDGGRQQITGWLYASLRENKPYDQFVRELIDPAPESSGFSAGIKWRGNVNASQVREVQFAQNISQVFLGINMKCASCHDSFIDRWKLDEAYGLAAIYATQPLEIHRCDKPTGRTAQAAWIFPELGTIDAAAPQPERLKELAGLMTHRDNGRFTRTLVNRLWHRLMGRGIVHPVDAMHTEPWNADLLDYLAEYLVERQYDQRQAIRLIVSSHAYQSQSVVQEEEPSAESYVYRGPIAKRLTAEQYLDSIWQLADAWPAPDGRGLSVDGRAQGGQLVAVLKAEGQPPKDAAEGKRLWGDRPVRAVLTPGDVFQESLGRPRREQVVTTRPDLLTTLEAINLANGQELADTLSQAAGNLLQRPAASPQDFVRQLYQAALSREPTAGELELAVSLVGSPLSKAGVEDFLWSIFMLPEFQLNQ